MESRLVAEFMEKTGADATVAYSTLQAKKWDLNLALQSHHAGSSGSMSHSQRWTFPTPLVEENGNLDEGVSGSSTVYTARPPLQKTEAIDFAENKKLTRGISRATDNVNLVSKARCNIAHDFTENTVYNVNQYFIETPIYTFTLPDLTIYPVDFRCFLEKDLIELSSLASLEQAGRLNWWTDSGACQRLWPLATTGDGNCLLHAASLGMWGFHDRLLTLRKALHGFLTGSECREALWRRWRWQQTRLNSEAGLVYSEDEWRREWAEIVSMASTEPRKLGGAGRRRSVATDRDEVPENATYESLEEIHVLALAHVLRRTIVVVADLMLKDVHGEDLAPIPFGGVYIPLECPPADCHRSPLVLTYDAAHFSALVVMETETFADKLPQSPAVIPVTDADHVLLPIQFSVDPGEQFAWGRDEENLPVIQRHALTGLEKLCLLREYLDVVEVPIPSLTPSSDDTDVDDFAVLSNDEEEIDKRFVEVSEADGTNENAGAESNLFNTNKSKAAKQLQSVAKQFGSIGKSMSKRIKKNLGSIGKLARSNSQKKEAFVPRRPARRASKHDPTVSRSQNHILCAQLQTEKRHEYQEEMIRNYLQSARSRFERDRDVKQSEAAERLKSEVEKLRDVARIEGPTQCINAGCNSYGTAVTSYMCRACFEKQQTQERTSVNSPAMSRAYATGTAEPSAPRYGTGKSRFYAESDADSHHTISQLPLSRAGSNVDHTLYLSKSTFYNDNLCLDNQGYYSQELGRRSPNQAGHDIKWHDEGSKSSVSSRTKQPSSAEQTSRIHSYNLARVQDRGLSVVNGSSQTLATVGGLETSRNVSVASLNSQPSNDLPSVERVNRVWLTGVKLPVSGAHPCRTAHCKFFGSADSDFLCSKCHKELVFQIGNKSLRVSEMRR